MPVLATSVLASAPPLETTLLAQVTTTTTAPTPGPVIQLQGSWAVALVVAGGLVFAFMWAIPFWVDARRAYKLREDAVKLIGGPMLDAAVKNGLTVTELRELLRTIGEPATGQRGLARGLMAFTIITVVGVTLVALLLSGATDAGDLRKTVITSLLTLLGTIVGFYFGTRAAETGVELASAETAKQPVEPPKPVTDGSGDGTPDGTTKTTTTTTEVTETMTTTDPTAITDATATAGTAEGTAPAPAPATGPTVAEEPGGEDDDPEESLEAGLSTLSADEIVALDERLAAEHGEPGEVEVEDEPVDEDDVPFDDEDDEDDGGGEPGDEPAARPGDGKGGD